MLRIIYALLLTFAAVQTEALVTGPGLPRAAVSPFMHAAPTPFPQLAAKAAIDAKQAAAAVKKRYQGKILSVQLIDSKGPPVYRVKTITPAGVVKVVFVDGESGAVFE